MGEQSQGIDNILIHTFTKQVVNREVRVLDDIMQKSTDDFLSVIPSHSHCQRMQNGRLAIKVFQSLMTVEGYS